MSRISRAASGSAAKIFLNHLKQKKIFLPNHRAPADTCGQSRRDVLRASRHWVERCWKLAESGQHPRRDGLAEIAVGAAHIKKANTLSKLMDQEYGFYSQIHDLLSAQATGFMQLMESAEIGFEVMLSRRIDGQPA